MYVTNPYFFHQTYYWHAHSYVGIVFGHDKKGHIVEELVSKGSGCFRGQLAWTAAAVMRAGHGLLHLGQAILNFMQCWPDVFNQKGDFLLDVTFRILKLVRKFPSFLTNFEKLIKTRVKEFLVTITARIRVCFPIICSTTVHLMSYTYDLLNHSHICLTTYLWQPRQTSWAENLCIAITLQHSSMFP